MALSDLIPWHRDRHPSEGRRPADPISSLQRELNRVFEDFAQGSDFAPWLGAGAEGFPFQPSLDVRETEDEILVTADLPGLEEKDIELKLSSDTLTLRGERREERKQEEGELPHRIERAYGSFQRTVSLPCEVDAEKAEAVFTKGVLSVTLPKVEEARRSVHRIEVKAG